jgi:hypothetical protein
MTIWDFEKELQKKNKRIYIRRTNYDFAQIMYKNGEIEYYDFVEPDGSKIHYGVWKDKPIASMHSAVIYPHKFPTIVDGKKIIHPSRSDIYQTIREYI